MLQLRERIMAMRDASSGKGSDEVSQCRLSPGRGAYILNPSGDLTRTQATLEPFLNALPSETHAATKSGHTPTAWTRMVQQKPDEATFASTLATSDITLYFGHGSGNQYIRPRTIEQLDKCSAVVWLMGCSSGSATEHGELETTSVPLSYLLAGCCRDEEAPPAPGGMCMAVVATLWDVTDRDIDKFSVAVGKRWGLFHDEKRHSPDHLSVNGSFASQDFAVNAPKTPRKKAAIVAAPPKTPKTPGNRTTAPRGGTTVARRNKKTKEVEEQDEQPWGTGNGGDGGEANGRRAQKMSLSEAVAKSRDVCYLRYLNGAASVVYGIPVYLE